MVHPVWYFRRPRLFQNSQVYTPKYVDLRLSRLRNFSLTLFQTSAPKIYIEPQLRTGTTQAKQNDSYCASISGNQLEEAIGQQSHLYCPSSQNQRGQYLYLRYPPPNTSTTILDHTMTETSVPRYQKSALEQLMALVRAAIVHTLSNVVLVVSGSSFPVLIVSFMWLYFTGSLFFDIAHYFLHKFSKSRYWILRRIGYLHEVHHLYFNRRLKFNDRYLWQNMLCELPLELSCQLFGTWLGYLPLRAFSLTGPGLLTPELFHLVLVFEIIRSFVVAILEGRDSNHQSYSTVVPKDPHSFLVGPEYHALHHVDPSAYIGSSFRVFDWFLGTSYTLRSRRVTIIGLSRVFSQAMKEELESNESVTCIQELSIHENDEKMVETLASTDVLIIGGEEESCKSQVQTIELFKQNYNARPGCLLLPEVWYIDNQMQKHSSLSAEAAFTNYSRKCYAAKDVLYRHILISNPSSKLGKVFLGPDFAAKAALWWIRRGARYVQIASPGSALWGYFTFFYGVRD